MALSVWALGAATVGVGISATITTTLIDNTVAGDLASGWVQVQSNGVINSISDSKGNTWTVRTAFVDGTSKFYFVDSVLTTALLTGDTISVVCSTAANRKYAVFQAIRGQAVSYFDQEGVGATGTSTTPTITTGTLAQADSVIIAAVYSVFDSVSVEDSDYTGLITASLDTRHMRSSYHIVSSTAPDTYSPTLGSSRAWNTNYIVYKAATSTPTVRPDTFLLLGVSR